MTNYVTEIFSLVSLALLWVLFWLYKDHSVATFRQRVFSLRDEMFDMAMAGKIPFNHKGYGRLRVTMNGSIRYAEEISLVRVLLFALLNRKNQNAPEGFSAAFLKEINDLPFDQKMALCQLHNRFSALITKHAIYNSPITIFILILPITLYLSLKSASSWFRKNIVLWFKKRLEIPLDEVQSLAYVIGRD
jgi:hypothetical protein